MFAKKQRIPREIIEEIFEKRLKPIQNTDFSIKKMKNNLKKPRFSVIVSKKIEKLSTKRHQIKRRAINQIKNIDIKEDADFVIVVKNNLSNKKPSEINSKLAELLN